MERFALTEDAINELSRLTADVFGYEIDLWPTGAGYNLVLGKTGVSRDNWTEYQTAAAGQELVDEQGDGIRSFVGILIALLSERAPIVLIDEPEAFLHPPQARRLGGIISQFASRKQVFLASHSAEIAEGALEKSEDALIARISRFGTVCGFKPLEQSAVLNMAKNPLIRHANLIDGLFSDATIICESDRDAAFYEQVWNSRARNIDVHFTHAVGGKSRIPNAVEVLQGSGLPVASVTDIDVLESKKSLKKLYSAHGGTLDPNGEQILRTIHDEVRSLGTQLPNRSDILELLQEFLDEDEEFLTTDEVERARSAIQKGSGWKTLQQEGLTALSETTRGLATELMDTLKHQGVFVVPGGEMESFVPSVKGIGKRNWIIKVLGEGLAEKSEIAQNFVDEIESFFVSRLRNDTTQA